MATLAAIRTAIKTTITATLANVNVYPKVPEDPQPPCICVVPVDADFNVAMGRGTDTWNFDLHVMVPFGEGISAQDSLDPLVDGSGTKSIRQIIFNARTLGLANTNAHISHMSDYGGRMESVGVPHVGATLRLVVHTPGTG